jgi:hypothetical protein
MFQHTGFCAKYSTTQADEIRVLGAAPDIVVGSAHALTETGELQWASATGSQIGPIVSGAGQVILVIGTQKIVADVATGEKRIRQYVYPLEDVRAREAYGMPSQLNMILTMFNPSPFAPGRFTIVLVKENVGF